MKEKNILSVLADNPALMEAVKTLLIKHFEGAPIITPETSDELLGQFLRAKTSGIKALEEGFKEIAQYKTVSNKQARVNPAR